MVGGVFVMEALSVTLQVGVFKMTKRTTGTTGTGQAGTMGAEETAGFMRAVADCAPLGYSLYEFPITSRSAWKALRSPQVAVASGGFCS